MRDPELMGFRPPPELRRKVYRRAAQLRWRRRAAFVMATLALVPAAFGIVALLTTEEAQVDVVAATPTTQGSTEPAVEAHAESPRVTIRRVDTTDFPVVSLDAMSDKPIRPADLELWENNQAITIGQAEKLPTPKGIVLVVDTSGSMAQGGKLESTKKAIRDFVAAKQPQDQLAIVGFNNSAAVVQGLTTDVDRLQQSVGRMQASNETALWDGVTTGLRILTQSATDLQANLVIITDGRDTVSSDNFTTARSMALAANASVFSVGIEGPELDASPLRDLARATGGTLQVGAADAVNKLVGNANALLQGQYEVSYTSGANTPLELELGAGGARDRVTGVGAGTITKGSTDQPVVIETRGPPRWLAWRYTRPIISLFVLMGIALLGYGLLGPWARASDPPKRPA
jgi:uncharacterized protein YegL